MFTEGILRFLSRDCCSPPTAPTAAASTAAASTATDLTPSASSDPEVEEAADPEEEEEEEANPEEEEEADPEEEEAAGFLTFFRALAFADCVTAAKIMRRRKRKMHVSMKLDWCIL